MNLRSNLPHIEEIKQAHLRIKPFIHRTPVFTSQSINAITSAFLYFKCENFQKVGAFKYRGATNAVLLLPEKQRFKGVATHSSGNHAAALALAARRLNIPAYIVMPENSPEVKKKAVAGYGGIITHCEPTLQARERTLEKVIAETGATFIHPYNRKEIIQGQATAALEFLEQIPEPDMLIAPVGGGGLLSGTAITAKNIAPATLVFGAEPKGADDARKSFYKGEIVPSVNPETIADGLLTSLGSLTFQAISACADDIFTVSEPGIILAMRLIWERMKIVVEPSAAVGLAVVLEYPEQFTNKKVGIILSGGNVDLKTLPF
ncbi:MAG: pyridoxal-phosphate dependent enzyme [Bacteroidota bacterium]